ncbi:MAG: hypothetical protein HY707_02915 [Ignavibacteriae bacterium]|nr:hypothetical protein [Ignavibacteriota bacterium]
MPSSGQVTFYTGASSQDGDDNHFWNDDPSDSNKNFLRFGSSGAKQTFIQTIDKPSPPTENPYNNDFWLVINAKFDGTNWNRVDTTKPAFALNLRAMTDIPFESGTKGACLWVAQSGSNPIGAFGATDGWRAAWIATQYRDFVIGGFGIEIDGNNTEDPLVTPYGRVINNNANWGILTNLFLDLNTPGRDVLLQSWFAGIVGDAFKVRRDPTPTSKTSPIAWQDFFHIDNAGKVGLQTINPTALLHLATAGGAGHLRMDGISGDPSTPTDGDYWYNTNQKAHRFKETAGSAGLVGLVYANTAQSNIISNTTAETDFDKNYTLPANCLTVVKAVRVKAYGRLSTAATAPTLNLRLRYGGTLLTMTSSVTLGASLANVGWYFEGLIICRATGASGSVQPNCFANFDTIVKCGTLTTPVTINTTTANVLKITASWGTASPSNAITLTNVTYEVLN